MMKRASRKKVERYHDRVAHRYDHIYDDLYWQWHDTLTWEYLKPHLPVQLDQPVVDLGCGTGKWGIKLAQSGYSVTCVDISHQMLEVVHQKISQSGLERRVQCVQADLVDLSALSAERSSLAIALGEPLCSVSSVPKALKAIHAILKPQGVLIATIDNRLNALDFYLERSDVEGLEQFIKTGKTHWLTQDRAEQFELQTFTVEQISRLLDEAGFEWVECWGKTILPMRKFRHLLEDKNYFRSLLTLEKRLSRLPSAIGRAAHLQFAVRKRSA